MAEIEDLKIVGGSTYTVGNQDIVANEWEAGKTYVKNKSYVIREHRLYVCNVTHTSVEPFDATKWTEITIGDAIAANTTAIGDLTQLTTTTKSSLVGAVNEVNGKVNCALISQNRLTSDYTLTSNTATRVFDDGTANLSAGNYIFEVTFPAIWSSASGVIHGGIRVDNTYTEASIIYGPQEVCGMITFKGTVNISSAGTHTIGSAIRTEAGKTVTIKSYVSATVTLWRC